jgi:FkbM family methyltransferase
MNSYKLRQWVRAQTRRVGFDVVRYPAAHDLAGHTRLLLEELHIDHVIDGGANVGQYARFMRQLGYKGRIISFEPVASTYDRLERAAADDPDWQPLRLALGSADGSVTINVTASSDMASLRNPARGAFALGGTVRATEVVEVRRLDSLLDGLIACAKPRIFLKLDTQGYDTEALRGATAWLDRIEAIQTEVSMAPLYDGAPTWLESMTLLADLGFVPSGMFPVTFHGGFRAIEFDLVAVRAGFPPSSS